MELCSSVPIHQFLGIHPHCLTYFAVHWNHETTVVSQVEIMSSLARDFCCTTQCSAYTNESSVQMSKKTDFIVSLKWSS